MVSRSLVSVVIPTYNRAQLLNEAIKSVLCQTYQEFEILVIDNHSSDNTIETIRKLDDPRITIHMIHNEGLVAKSRNMGIRNALGTYVAFLDSDDLWMPDKLAKQLKFLAENSDVRGCAANGLNMRGGRILRTPISHYRKNRISFERFLNGASIINSSVVVERKALLEVGLLDEHPMLQSVEDADMWARITRLAPFGYLREPLMVYRLHAGNDPSPLSPRMYMFEKWLSHDLISQQEYDLLVRHQLFGYAWHKDHRKTIRRYFVDPVFWIWLGVKLRNTCMLRINGVDLRSFPPPFAITAL